ncbi:MAG: peptidyl-prolyl cis-trans isomerase [Chlorobi bacterium]|nr:peptidyl-prolyl cis-trans isomerase [Chlorobiota bacterium]MBX7216293.1 peptidyl-prolyl cis-trans isomerase [Candidatus Kapabacteria bacterium]
MGVMQKLRQGMPAFIIIMILFFVLTIVFDWGNAKKGASGVANAGGQAIGHVNGDPINYREYQTRVDTLINRQRAANPDGEIDEMQIRESVWNQMVNEILLNQAAERLGVSVTDKQVDEKLLYDPPSYLTQMFSDSTGAFQQNVYYDFMRNTDAFLAQRQFPAEEIASIKNQFAEIRHDLRMQMLQEAVSSAITASAIPSPSEIRLAYDNKKLKASGSFAMLDVNSIPDDQVKVSDDDAKKYYDEHKADFVQKASRELRYVILPLSPSKQDSSTVLNRLGKATEALNRAATTAEKDSVFSELIAQFGPGNYAGTAFTPFQEIPAELQAALQGATPGAVIGPFASPEGTILLNVQDMKDSGEVFVKAQHILLKTEGVSNTDSLKALAESILKKAKSGEKFEALVTTFSQDQGSAMNGGDVGYFSKTSPFVQEFKDAALGANVGDIVGPVKTQFGYHVIKITDKTARSYKLRDMRFNIKTTRGTKNALMRRAQMLRDTIASGQALDSAFAAKRGLQSVSSGPIQKSMPVAGMMELTYFAYANNVGEVSKPIEMQNGNIIIAQVAKIRNAGTAEFADVKAEIIKKLRTQKKLDMLKDRATKLRGALAAGDSLEKLKTIDPGVQVMAFNDVNSTSPFPGAGFDVPLTAATFALNPGQFSDAVRGERGYYIVQLQSKTVPTDQEFQKDRAEFIKEFMSTRRSSLFQEWIQKAREQADIEDLRHQS